MKILSVQLEGRAVSVFRNPGEDDVEMLKLADKESMRMLLEQLAPMPDMSPDLLIGPILIYTR